VKLPGKAETYLYVIFEPGTKVWWRMHVNLTPQEIGGFATNELWAVPGLGLARIEARDRLFAEISTAKADSLAVAAGATFTEFEETIRSHSPMAGFAEYGAVLDEAVGEDFFREPKSTYIAPNVRVTSVEYRNNKWRIEISSVRMQSSAALEFDASFRMLRAWRDGALVYPK
jgi:hypothetical protein